MNFVLSRWFAGLVLIEIGKPFCSTATCIFAPKIFLNPPYPILSPLFWQQSMRSQLIFFGGQSCLACVRILLVWREFSSCCIPKLVRPLSDIVFFSCLIINNSCSFLWHLSCICLCRSFQVVPVK